MKKLGYLLLLSSVVLLVGGCSKQASEQDVYTEYTGTISYHNPELDRGDGQETRMDRIVKLNIEGEQAIQLGCIASEESLELKSDVIVPVVNKDGTYSFAIMPITQILPSSLSNMLVKIKITKPIFTYSLTSDLPDRVRVGDCTADVKAKDIEVTKKE